MDGFLNRKNTKEVKFATSTPIRLNERQSQLIVEPKLNFSYERSSKESISSLNERSQKSQSFDLSLQSDDGKRKSTISIQPPFKSEKYPTIKSIVTAQFEDDQNVDAPPLEF